MYIFIGRGSSTKPITIEMTWEPKQVTEVVSAQLISCLFPVRCDKMVGEFVGPQRIIINLLYFLKSSGICNNKYNTFRPANMKLIVYLLYIAILTRI